MNINEIKSRLKGNIVPVPAQFNEDLSINIPAIEMHVTFLIQKGIQFFYLAASASQFDYMSRDERLLVTKSVAAILPGHCILLAQSMGGHSFEEQLTEAKMMMDRGATAIVIAPRGIKEGNKFFSSFYERGFYSPDRHDDYFIAYMEKMAEKSNAPLVYHNKSFSNGRGPSMDMLHRIVAIDNVVALKEHISDPGSLRKVYRELGDKVVCFDGFGKTVQFWSMQWGAKARHTCWAWFDPDREIKFFTHIENGNLNNAAEIVNDEWPIAEAIAKTGFQGYLYIMELMGLPSGPVRIPGERLNERQKEMVKNAVNRIGLLRNESFA
ncbi:MAG: dihydrodipicolinate synthase family protein [Deltaproteobacteria bacterium]|nr:dihydrodipicolinate synthase family protein [Deltaproteobacteria bacterium]